MRGHSKLPLLLLSCTIASSWGWVLHPPVLSRLATSKTSSLTRRYNFFENLFNPQPIKPKLSAPPAEKKEEPVPVVAENVEEKEESVEEPSAVASPVEETKEEEEDTPEVEPAAVVAQEEEEEEAPKEEPAATAAVVKGQDDEEEVVVQEVEPVASALSSDAIHTGNVKWFDRVKGFGFISPSEGDQDIFVHQTAIHSTGYRFLMNGEEVEFQLEDDNQGRPKAIHVTGPGGAEFNGNERTSRARSMS